jgi:hypothetical protein
MRIEADADRLRREGQPIRDAHGAAGAAATTYER